MNMDELIEANCRNMFPNWDELPGSMRAFYREIVLKAVEFDRARRMEAAE